LKLLFISQYVYRPEQPGANRIFEFLQLLARRGVQPHVIAGGVHYLQDTLDPELARRKLIDTRWGDVPVTLTYASADFRRGVISRLRSYLSFAWYALRAALRVKRIDAVMVSIQPIFVAPLAWLVARLRRVPFLLEVRDLWPDAAVEVGLIRSRALIRLGRWLEMFIYRRARHIVVIGPEMKNVLVAKGIDPERIEVVPQGFQQFGPYPPERAAARGRLGVDDDFVLMFTGSFGLANNDLPLIIDAAARLKNEPGLSIVMVGEGNQKRRCVERAEREGIGNIRFLPMLPKAEVHTVLAAADACVMTLPPGDFWKICLQNKIFDYLGYGLPVVAAVAGDQARLLAESGGGIVTTPGDASELVRAILRLKSDPAERRRMGASGRRYVERHLMREQILSRYVSLVEQWLGREPGKTVAESAGGAAPTAPSGSRAEPPVGSASR
jgi:glycosyltransferase involved in cell wall biosynthesis